MASKRVFVCDGCGKENPNGEWSNMCDSCREDFQNRVKRERERTELESREFWDSKPE